MQLPSAPDPAHPPGPDDDEPTPPTPPMGDSSRTAAPSKADMAKSQYSSNSGKVAIPRMHRAPGGAEDESLGSDKHRVSHACEPCRQRKTKCSGEKPVCKHCQDFKINCHYADGKRDRAKTELFRLKRKVEVYEKLLEQIRPQLDSAGQLLISNALRGNHLTGDVLAGGTELNRDGESLVTAEVGSTGSMDHITDDFNDCNPYPTGYMGKNSEVTWIQRVANQLAEEAREQSPSQYAEVVDDEYQFKTPTYHLDDLSVSIAGGHVDPYSIPSKPIADELVNAFFTTVWPTFPIISKKLFIMQYEAFYESFFPPNSSKRWLAMLNLICAIGSLYGKLVHAEWKTSDTEHLRFFARARVLSLDDGSIFEVADLQQVQVVGMAGLYLVCSNQTNRAFNTIGLALRYAETLGLNLRNDVPELNEVEKETRARMWHTLYSTEHLLCCMTGRPSAIHERDCSVPLPRPVDEDDTEDEAAFDALLRQYPVPISPIHRSSGHSQTETPMSTSRPGSESKSASDTPETMPPLDINLMPSRPFEPNFSHRPSSPLALYFLEHTKLNQITARVLTELYSPSTRTKSWSDVQGAISSFELETTRWRANLPAIFEFGKRHRDQAFARQRMALGFQYHNTRILINRPCLCRLDYRIPNESKRSKTFNRSAAATCISAAREMIALLPDEPNPVGLISISPWWCLLHHLVSAGVILMVEISMRAEHNPQQAEGLLDDSKKIVRWLRAMAKDSLAAERSWAVLLKLLIVSAPKIGRNTSDVERDLGDSHSLESALAMYNMQPEMSSVVQGIPAQRQPPVTLNQPSQTGIWPDSDTTFLFRGLMNSSFPYASHTPFDHHPMMLPGEQQLGPHNEPSPFGADSLARLDQSVGYMPMTVPEGYNPVPPPVNPQTEKVAQRAIRRSLQGVGSISMPPPAPYPPAPSSWDGSQNFMMPAGINNPYTTSSAQDVSGSTVLDGTPSSATPATQKPAQR